jgi:hypothetical protein
MKGQNQRDILPMLYIRLFTNEQRILWVFANETAAIVEGTKHMLIRQLV